MKSKEWYWMSDWIPSSPIVPHLGYVTHTLGHVTSCVITTNKPIAHHSRQGGYSMWCDLDKQSDTKYHDHLIWPSHMSRTQGSIYNHPVGAVSLLHLIISFQFLYISYLNHFYSSLSADNSLKFCSIWQSYQLTNLPAWLPILQRTYRR